MAEPNEGVLYADTSALVKLVVREAESDAIEAEVSRWDLIATSDIAAIELPRATARARADGRAGVADGRIVLEVLAALIIVPMTDDVRALAATLEPVELRTLDAIHLGCALALGDDLAGVLTYDHRMADAARARGVSVVAPA
ncbi:MAG: Ribonuclease VapC46 [Conexibacter sp.]|nr:Ribonuclease VapC46 [Conexibacter sp.]